MLGKRGTMLLILVLGLSAVSCGGTFRLGVDRTPVPPATTRSDALATLQAAVAATLTAAARTPTPSPDVEATVQAAVAATLAASEGLAAPEPTTVSPAPSEPRGLLYSTYLGGGDSDDVRDLAVDGEGNVYIVGTTSSPDLPTTPGAYDGSYNGNADAFVAKLSADGSTLLYSTYLGGSGEEWGNAIAVDGEGYIYVTGHTYSVDFPVTPGALDTMLNAERDAFVAKLSPAGDKLIYSTYLGGDSWDYGKCLAIGDDGSAYVGGFTHGSFPVTPGAAQTTFGGYGDGFVVRLSPDGGSMVYSTYVGGWSWEAISGIAVDHEGNAYLATGSPSSDFPTTPGAYDRVCEDCYTDISDDAAAVKLSADGSQFVYSTLVGGAGPDCGEGFNDVAVDSAGNAYLTGNTSCANYPTTPGTLQQAYRGGQHDVVVTKVNADGSGLLYSTYLGGAGDDWALGIAVDAEGNATVAGYTYSVDFPTAFPLQPANGGGRDAFVVQLNQDASTLLFGTYFGGSGKEFEDPNRLGGVGFSHTSRGVYLAAATNSTDLPTTASACDVSYNGGAYDGFVAFLGPSPSEPPAAPAPTPMAPTAAAPWEWVPAAPMAFPRCSHSATLLADDRVLLIAGFTDEQHHIHIANAEAYDPASGTYQSIASLNTARSSHTATLLPDERVLVLAGYNEQWLTDAEIFHPASGQWAISQPIFAHGGGHTATLLQDGRVLVVAGNTRSGSPGLDDRVEVFDPVTNQWQTAAPHANTEAYHTAILLADGRVLVAGGGEYAEPSLYDPASDTWQPAGSLAVRRAEAPMVQLRDGRVLLVGGVSPVHPEDPIRLPVLSSVEVYDPATNTWQEAAPMAEARFRHTATLLPDGRVLAIGGASIWDNPPWDGHEILSSVEIYDPDTNTWSSLPPLRQARVSHSATLLPDGRVFVAGGKASYENILASTEIMRPGDD